jgi:hypothetical protein
MRKTTWITAFSGLIAASTAACGDAPWAVAVDGDTRLDIDVVRR